MITPHRSEYRLERVAGASRYVVGRYRTEDEAVRRLRVIQLRERAEIRQTLQRNIRLEIGSR